MVSVSASIDAASVSAFNSALSEYQKTMRKDAETAPRMAAIMVCKSLRARTKVSKKNKGMKVVVSEEKPKWISYKNGQKLPKPLRRWKVTLTDRGRTFTKYVYAGTTAEMKQQLRLLVGTNYYPLDATGNGLKKKGGVRGLAKRSWGWVMHNIYNGAAPDTPWQRRNRDKRNPKDAAKESTSRPFLAVISNRLGYAMDALKGGSASINEAIEKATNSILKRVKTRNFGRS